MNKSLCFLVLFQINQLTASLIGFKDSSSENRFLGLDISMCSTKTTGSGMNYQEKYECGNSSITAFLNMNFLDEALLGQQFYMFNNFMYWIGKNLKSGNQNAIMNPQPDKIFSGSGIFMISLGTNPSFREIVAPEKKCPQGQRFLGVQLKYNDGYSIATWSQDAICLAPTDQFEIVVSSDLDNTVPEGKPVQDSNLQGVDLMKDSGTSQAYRKAHSSPRKVRLIKK